LTILRALNHPKILAPLDFKKDGIVTQKDGQNQAGIVYQVFEQISDTNIFDWINKNGPLPQKIARYYFKHLISAIEHMHEKDIAHLDVRLENLLLDKNFDLKLTEFGFAKLLSGKNHSGRLLSAHGNDKYLSPEMHSKKPYSGTCADIFAAGIILYVLCTGVFPFQKASKEDMVWKQFFLRDNIKKFAANTQKKVKAGLPDAFINLVYSMLNPDPTLRATIGDIKNHPWFTDGETATLQQVQCYFEKHQNIFLEANS